MTYMSRQSIEKIIEIVRLLVRYGADVHKPYSDRITPYEYALGHFLPAINIFDQFDNHHN